MVLQIFANPFTTYGDVTLSGQREVTSHVENLTFLPSEPANITEMDNLVTIFEIANMPIAIAQEINITFTHFKNPYS